MTAHHTMLQFISARDHKLMRKVNQWAAPRWIRFWAIAATRGGAGWLCDLAGLAVCLFGGHNRLQAIAAAGLAALLGVCSFIILKNVSGPTRPCAIEAHCWAELLPPYHFSFASCHPIPALALTVPFSFFYPSTSVPFL